MRPPLTPDTPASASPAGAMLRVLVVDHTAELAGGEVALARLLHAVNRQRYDVEVLLLADGPLVPRLRADGIQVRVLPVSRRLTNVGRAAAVSSPFALAASVLRTVGLIPRLTAAIRSSDPDLVVANTLKAAVLVSLCAPLSVRRWVWHVHDRIAGDYLPGPMVRGLRAMASLAPRAVIANSRATRETLPGVPDDRIVVAYPGVDVRQAAPRREPTEYPSFGLLGRIAPTKGQLEFVRAAAILAPTMPDAVFTVIGDTMFNDAEFGVEVRALPATLGIADRVLFPGWAMDASAAIADLTALVHASPLPEPFGQVLVEAMLVGVPVIATNAGGAREILDPERGAVALLPGVAKTPLGLLVDAGDSIALASAMRWVAENAAEVGEMTVRAKASATALFDIALSSRRTEQMWTRAAAQGRASDVAVVESVQPA